MKTHLTAERRHLRRGACTSLVLLCALRAFPALADCPTNAVVEVQPNPDKTVMLWSSDGKLLERNGKPPVVPEGFAARVIECRESEHHRQIYLVQVSPSEQVWLSPANVPLKFKNKVCDNTTQPTFSQPARSGVDCASKQQ